MTETIAAESTPAVEGNDFRSGLHYHAGPATLPTRVVKRLSRTFLSVVARLKFLGSIDLGQITTISSEQLLNLPGMLPFFPTKATELTRVKNLLRRLYPIKSEHGLVRLGPDKDGGYLVPNDLEGIEACYSPGVSNVSGFERQCAEIGMKVFMADASVDRPAENHPQFVFSRKYVGSVTEGDFISLSDWVTSTLPNSNSDLLLQIDIEGYEYETFLGTPGNILQRFRIIVAEFHNLDCLFSEPIFAIYSKAFEKLLRTHTCVHIHPNNMCSTIRVQDVEIPQLAEFTFLRNDRVTSRAFATQFPHPLDRDNTDRKPLVLPRSCYASGGKAKAES